MYLFVIWKEEKQRERGDFEDKVIRLTAMKKTCK